MFEYSLRRDTLLPQETIEILELHRLAQEFHQEQAHRRSLEDYYRWYDETAQQNQQEHTAMQKELNLFALFWKKRRA